jgi:hypothetical protein
MGWVLQLFEGGVIPGFARAAMPLLTELGVWLEARGYRDVAPPVLRVPDRLGSNRFA